MTPPALDALVRRALAEDVGRGDVTTQCTVDPDARGRAVVLAKQKLVVAGVEPAAMCFRIADEELTVERLVGEGAEADPGDAVLRVAGRLAPVLTAERTALNFMAHLSGIATLTRAYVEAVRGTGSRILDTRKTTPGWRALEKAAVRAGGGTNHRMALDDLVLLKDNHVAAAGGFSRALSLIEAAGALPRPVVVEVSTLNELELALGSGVDRLLLDNMDLETLRKAVRCCHELGERRPELEASGNVSLGTVRAVAETGVDWISVGALTHSAPAADLTLRVES